MRLTKYTYESAATLKALFTLWPLFILKDPRRLKFLFGWLYSLRPDAAAFKDGIPLVPYEAIEWLDSHLKKEMTAFEYGSGGSTSFIAKRVKRLISIEHDPKWYDLVSNSLNKKGISNCDYIFKEPNSGKSDGLENLFDPRTYLSKYIKGVNFKDYCQVIESYPDDYFDFILVDGRARPSCIFHAYKKVRPGGVLMLDDSYRERYRKAILLLEGWDKRSFREPKPYLRGIHFTALWQKPKE